MLDYLGRSDESVVNLENHSLRGGGSCNTAINGNIVDFELIAGLLQKYQPQAVASFVESHVDRIVHGPEDFIQTNIVGTVRLLYGVRAYWGGMSGDPLLSAKDEQCASLVEARSSN